MNANTPIPGSSALGQPMDRVDGRLKVTGQARYAGEYPEAGLLHSSVVSSSIASGRVVRIDASQALAVPGVVAVIDHTNRPHIASYDEDYQDADSAEGSPFRPFYNDRVLYSGQPLALVVADTLELARHAGSLVRIEYETESHQTDLSVGQSDAHTAPAETPKPRRFSGGIRSICGDCRYPLQHAERTPQPDGTARLHGVLQG
jgi:xanthine dehydrogenase YagR molybdenum-binding subunit